MFLDILDMISSCFGSVIRAFDVPLFTYGGVSFTFWEIVLGIFTVSILFGFFLRQRGGSVFGALNNINEHEKAQQREADRVQAREYRAKQLEYYRSRMNGGK